MEGCWGRCYSVRVVQRSWSRKGTHQKCIATKAMNLGSGALATLVPPCQTVALSLLMLRFFLLCKHTTLFCNTREDPPLMAFIPHFNLNTGLWLNFLKNPSGKMKYKTAKSWQFVPNAQAYCGWLKPGFCWHCFDQNSKTWFAKTSSCDPECWLIAKKSQTLENIHHVSNGALRSNQP